ALQLGRSRERQSVASHSTGPFGSSRREEGKGWERGSADHADALLHQFACTLHTSVEDKYIQSLITAQLQGQPARRRAKGGRGNTYKKRGRKQKGGGVQRAGSESITTVAQRHP
ncbi:hypothetical protein TcCL_ESM05624, partial [Trypanosoma cruzi]